MIRNWFARLFARWFGAPAPPAPPAPIVAERTPLAVLSAEERDQINQARELIMARRAELDLMAMGLNSLWWQMRTKHKFPADIDYVPATGEIFEGKTSGG